MKLRSTVIGVSALIGAVATIGSAVHWALDRYDRQFRWADRTEKVLEALRPNVTAKEFDERLGRPRVVAPSKIRKTTQRLYQGRGYWVQAVVGPDETVLWFAVTVCSPKLRPSWQVWNGRDAYIEIKLQETNVVEPASFDLAPSGYQWNIPWATANEFIYALYYGGNPTNYQTYAWGYNDACLGEAVHGDLQSAELDTLQAHYSSGDDDTFQPEIVEHLPDALDAIFQGVRSNTFAMFGIFQPTQDLQDEFQIGATRTLTRTLME